MSCIGRLHNIMKKNILILEGRETIGGGQIITKKICKILSESNNVSVFYSWREKCNIRLFI